MRNLLRVICLELMLVTVTTGATINLNSTSLTSGGSVSITSATLTIPAGS